MGVEIDYIEALINKCHYAKEVMKKRSDHEFTLSCISLNPKEFSANPDSFKEERKVLLARLPDFKHAIYIIEQIGDEIQNTYKSFHQEKPRDRNYSRNNGLKDQSLSVLYVGSSTTGLKNRISQHIGYGNSKKTYALNLKHWFKGEFKIKIQDYSDVEPEVLLIIEDAISHKLKPAFGKSGSNNKRTKTEV